MSIEIGFHCLPIKRALFIHMCIGRCLNYFVSAWENSAVSHASSDSLNFWMIWIISLKNELLQTNTIIFWVYKVVSTSHDCLFLIQCFFLVWFNSTHTIISNGISSQFLLADQFTCRLSLHFSFKKHRMTENRKAMTFSSVKTYVSNVYSAQIQCVRMVLW